jgi:hypothetical protein
MCRRSARLCNNALWMVPTCIVCMVVSCVSRSGAEEIDYPDFSYPFGLELNGDAESVVAREESVLRIVPAREGQGGTFFYHTQLPVTNFHTEFSFHFSEVGGIYDCDTEVGGDGLVFAIQPVSATFGGRDGGGRLAFYDVSPSIGVEFDTFRNLEHADVTSNHLGVNTNGNTESHVVVDVAERFDNGKKWFAWIDYDGTTLEVRANQSGVRPDAPQLKYPIDIPAVIDSDTAYVGFTAATGGAIANHDILSWRFEGQPSGDP